MRVGERELDYDLTSLGRVVNHTAVQSNKHGTAWPGARMKHNLNTEAGRRGQLTGQRSAAALWALVKGSELTFSNRDCTSAQCSKVCSKLLTPWVSVTVGRSWCVYKEAALACLRALLCSVSQAC